MIKGDKTRSAINSNSFNLNCESPSTFIIEERIALLIFLLSII